MPGMGMPNGNLSLPDECHFSPALDLEGYRRRIRHYVFSLIDDSAELVRNRPERRESNNEVLASMVFALGPEKGNAFTVEMRALDSVTRLAALQRMVPAKDLKADESHAPEASQPISSLEKLVDSIVAKVPEEEWDKLPPDLSSRIDYYLYGIDRE